MRFELRDFDIPCCWPATAFVGALDGFVIDEPPVVALCNAENAALDPSPVSSSKFEFECVS